MSHKLELKNLATTKVSYFDQTGKLESQLLGVLTGHQLNPSFYGQCFRRGSLIDFSMSSIVQKIMVGKLLHQSIFDEITLTFNDGFDLLRSLLIAVIVLLA